MRDLSPKTRRTISRILPFGMIWFLMSVFFLVIDFAAVANVELLPDTAIQVNTKINVFATLAVTCIGLLVGVLELFYINKRFAHRRFVTKIIGKTVFYFLLMEVVILITYPIAASLELGTNVADPEVWAKYIAFLPSTTHLGTITQLAFMLGISLFYAEISDHMGHRVLKNLFTGKYHTPREEARIFMFSDMKSSTKIAEEIGHVRYYELLRAYYDDLSDGIVNFDGEVYQYVGDEVIVSWPVEVGLKNHHCIGSFLAMKADLEKKADWYQAQFGLVPEFKAGMHVGTVTTGEIGALKKEIVFTGDVLNATARIQGQCNTIGVDLLISENLVALLGNMANVDLRSVGECALRGKQRAIELFTLE